MWMLWLVWERRQLGSLGQLCLMLTLHLPSSCRRRSLWKGLALHCLIQVLWSSSSWPGRTFHLCWAVEADSQQRHVLHITQELRSSPVGSRNELRVLEVGSAAPGIRFTVFVPQLWMMGVAFQMTFTNIPFFLPCAGHPCRELIPLLCFEIARVFDLKIARCRSKWTLRKQLVRPSLHYFLLFARWRVHIPNFKGIKLQACHESGTFILSDTI